VQASDVLAWYRAFHPDVDDAISVEQYFTGMMTLHGWPLQLDDAAFSSEGGAARVPGFVAPLRIGAIEGGRQHARFMIDPVTISYGASGTRAESPAATKAASTKRLVASEGRGTVNIRFAHDFEEHAGRVAIDGHVERVQDVLKMRRLSDIRSITAGSLPALPARRCVGSGMIPRREVAGMAASTWQKETLRRQD